MHISDAKAPLAFRQCLANPVVPRFWGLHRLGGPPAEAPTPATAAAAHRLTPFASRPQVAKLLQYSPRARLSALEALGHPYFDELRDASTRLPNGAR